MFWVVLVGGCIITVNVIIQAVSNLYWLKRITSFFKNKKISSSRIVVLLISSFLFFTFLHLIHTLIWAIGFYIIPTIATDFSNFLEVLYFSIVTFTTLGYGDITISSHWRLLSGFEAINGIMLIGWSTAIMYSLIQHIYKKINN